MATDPASLLMLIGLGIQQFSISAPYIPRLKEFISLIDSAAANRVAQQALTMADSASIRALLEETIDNFSVQ
jgi:phosphotransferase system enzyme I (PtsP)